MSLLLLAVLLSAAPPEPKEKLMVLEFATNDARLKRLGAEVTEQLLTLISKDPRLDPLGQSDLATLLGAERQKQLLGCSDETSTCMAEVAGALNAPWLLSGSIARLGKKARVDLKLISTNESRVLGREGRVVEANGEALSVAAAEMVGLLLKTLPPRVVVAAKPPEPPAPAPSITQAPPAPVARSLTPLVIIGAGGAVAIAGAVTLGVSFAQRGDLQAALSAGQLFPIEGQTRLAGLNTQSGVGVGLLITGAVTAAFGLAWWLFFDSRSPGVALVVDRHGAAVSLGGTF